MGFQDKITGGLYTLGAIKKIGDVGEQAKGAKEAAEETNIAITAEVEANEAERIKKETFTNESVNIPTPVEENLASTLTESNTKSQEFGFVPDDTKIREVASQRVEKRKEEIKQKQKLRNEFIKHILGDPRDKFRGGK